MLQFYIPEVVSVEQIFDEADEIQVNIRLGSVKTLTKYIQSSNSRSLSQ